MTPRFRAQRRAEAFHAAVEGESSRAHDDAELLELVGALRSTPPVAARPEFVGDLRERLMAEAATALAPAATTAQAQPGEVRDRLTVAPRRSARDRRLAVGLAAFALVGATGSVAVASQSALPGDVLYPVKRAIENAETGFSVNEHQKGETLLANASGRLHEADALARGGEDDKADEIATTLDTFTEQATEASELLVTDYEDNANADAIAELRDFAATSMADLTDLESQVPDSARGALVTAAQVLTQIDAMAQALCPVCGGEGISLIPPQFVTASVSDLLGELALGDRLLGAGDDRADTGATSGAGTDRPQGRDGGPGPDGPTLPQLGQDTPPGSVTDPGTDGSTTPDGGGEDAGQGADEDDGGQGPLGQIRDDIREGLTHDEPTAEPSLPVVTPVLEGVGDLLEQLTGGLLGDQPQP